MDLSTLLGLEDLPGDWQLIKQYFNWAPPSFKGSEMNESHW